MVRNRKDTSIQTFTAELMAISNTSGANQSHVPKIKTPIPAEYF